MNKEEYRQMKLDQLFHPGESPYFAMYTAGICGIPIEDVTAKLTSLGIPVRHKDIENWQNGMFECRMEHDSNFVVQRKHANQKPSFENMKLSDFPKFPESWRECGHRYFPCTIDNKPMQRWGWSKDFTPQLYDKESAKALSPCGWIGQNMLYQRFIVLDIDGEGHGSVDNEVIQFGNRWRNRTLSYCDPSKPGSFHLYFSTDRLIPVKHFPWAKLDLMGNSVNAAVYFKNKISNGLPMMQLDDEVWYAITTYQQRRKDVNMSLDPGTTNANWNYSYPNKEGYSDVLIGTVVAVQEVQAYDFVRNPNEPRTPRFWNNGDPVMNLRMAFATPTGELKTFTFAKAGKSQKEGKKPSVHMSMYKLFKGVNTLVGKTLQITTWPTNPGYSWSPENKCLVQDPAKQNMPWGPGNPRLFDVQVIDAGPYALTSPLPEEYTYPEILANTAASGGQVQPQNIQTPQAPPMQGAYYAAPQLTYQPQVNPYATQASTPMQQATPVNAAYNQYQGQPMQSNTAVAMQPQQPMQAQPVVQQQPMSAQPVQPQQIQTPEVVAQPVQPAIPAGMDPEIAAAMQNLDATNIQPIEGTVYDEDIPF